MDGLDLGFCERVRVMDGVRDEGVGRLVLRPRRGPWQEGAGRGREVVLHVWM